MQHLQTILGKKGATRVIAALVVVLLCTACSCAGLSAVFDRGAASTAPQTTTLHATTPVNPTATTKPTATPQPTATPNPNTPAKVEAYKTVVTTDSGILSADFGVVGADCGAATTAQDLATCQADLQTLITDADAYRSDLNTTAAPPCLKSADALIRKALTLTVNGSQSAINGINDYSVSEINAGSAQYKQATSYMNEAAAAIGDARC